MKFVAVLAVVLLAGCFAEGEIQEPDAGDLGFQSDFSRVNNVNNPTSDMTYSDVGYEFGELCDPFVQDCSAAGKCVPNPGTGEPTCLPKSEERALGQACESITQCAAGTHCAGVPDDPTTICRRLCDPNGLDTCPGSDACSVRLDSVPTVGLCVPAQLSCNIYTQDCPSGACVVTRNISNGMDGTYCGTAGSLAAGEACNSSEACQAAMICVQLAGANGPTCQPVCRIGTRPCPDQSLSCIGQSASTGVTFCKTP